jgi:hypothetical protein
MHKIALGAGSRDVMLSECEASQKLAFYEAGILRLRLRMTSGSRIPPEPENCQSRTQEHQALA